MDKIPTDAQVAQWKEVAAGKVSVLTVLAATAASGEAASSGYLRQQCGLSAEEWHGAGELLASLLCFAADRGFLEWLTRGMSEYEPGEQPPDAD